MNLTASDALRHLNEIAPGSILAGGYLRDMHFGVRPKDLDFFAPHGLTYEAICRTFPGACPETYSAFLEYSTSEVKAVYTIGLVDGLPAQVIVLEEGMTPEGRVPHMDFGFCQVWAVDEVDLNPSFGPQMTDECSDDWEDNTATLIYCEDQREFDRSMRRWERLKRKYPTRTLVIPEEFQKWVAQKPQ